MIPKTNILVKELTTLVLGIDPQMIMIDPQMIPKTSSGGFMIPKTSFFVVLLQKAASVFFLERVRNKTTYFVFMTGQKQKTSFVCIGSLILTKLFDVYIISDKNI